MIIHSIKVDVNFENNITIKFGKEISPEAKRKRIRTWLRQKIGVYLLAPALLVMFNRHDWELDMEGKTQ